MVRGLIQQINLFEIFMQAQMFKWKRVNLKTGKEEFVQVQGGLRRTPFGYEYIFPEECLDEVLTMLNIDEKTGAGDQGWTLSKSQLFFLRKMIGHGIEKIPKYKQIVTNRYVEMRGVAIYPIGIKRDARGSNEKWGYEQEML